MSVLFEKFIFDLQRFAGGTKVPFGGTSIAWGSAGPTSWTFGKIQASSPTAGLSTTAVTSGTNGYIYFAGGAIKNATGSPTAGTGFFGTMGTGVTWKGVTGTISQTGSYGIYGISKVTDINLGGGGATINGLSSKVFGGAFYLTGVNGNLVLGSNDSTNKLGLNFTGSTGAKFGLSAMGGNIAPKISYINFNNASGTLEGTTLPAVGYNFIIGSDSTAKNYFSVDKKFTYNYSPTSGKKTITLNDKGATFGLSGADIVDKIYFKNSGADSLTFAGGTSYISFNNATGGTNGAYFFTNASGSIAGFNFATTNDSLNLTEAGVINDFTSLAAGGDVFYGGTGGFSMAKLEGTLKMGSSNLFSLTGFENTATPMTLAGSKDTIKTTFNSTENNGLFFTAGTNAVTLNGVSIDSVAGGVSFAGFKKTGDISINGAAVNVGAGSFAFQFADKVGYIGLSAAHALGTKGLNVTKTGKAAELDITGLTKDDTLQAVSIGSGVYSIKAYGAATDTLKSTGGLSYGLAFKLDSAVGGTAAKATGFVFGGSGAIVFGKGITDTSFKFYDGKVSTEDALSLPTITSTGVVAVSKNSAANVTSNIEYGLVVNKGATKVATSVDSGTTTLDFSGLTKDSIYANVGFSTDGGFTTIKGAANPLDTSGAGATTLNGSIVVTGNVAEGKETNEGGIVFNGTADGTNELPVALATGNYTVGFDGSVAGAPASLTVDAAEETLYSAGGAPNVYLSEDSGTLTYSGNEDYEYAYKSSGKAYFTADTSTGGLNGFVFADKDDALTFSGIASDPLATLQYATGNKETPLATITATPTIEADTGTYTITRETAPVKNTPESALFELSGVAAEASVSVGGTPAVFAFSEEGGTILFDQTGAAKGLSVASGSATLDSTAAGLLAWSDTSDASTKFSIEGEGVNITAAAAGDLVYSSNGEDKSLYGVGDGAVIADAGVINKVYAPTTEGGAITFGDTTAETPNTVTFNVSVAGSMDEGNAAYFGVDHSSVKSFVFGAVDDAIKIGENMSLPSGFAFQNGADGDEFQAPVVYADSLKANTSEYTVQKTAEEQFALAGLATNQHVEFSQTKITVLQEDGSDGVNIAFDTEGNLNGIAGVAAVGDSVKVAGATEAVVFGEDDATVEVEIVGPSASFVYGIDDQGSVGIGEVYAESTINAAGGATNIYTAAGKDGLGKFTFAGNSVPYEVLGSEAADGVQFEIDENVAVLGISGVDANESIKGAFFDSGSFKFNGGQVAVTPGKEGTEYTLSGTSMAGLADKDVVVDAGTITDIITASLGGASATFEFGEDGKYFSVEGDKDGVTFKVSGASVSEVSGLDEGATVKGNFTGVTVNGDTIDIVGDEDVYLVAGAEGEGIAKVGGLSGEVTLNDIGEATQLGADGDGTFNLALGAEGTDDDASLNLEGNKEIETTFTLGEENIEVAGMDEGEKLTAWFQEEIVVEGHAIQVYNDEQITAVMGTSGVSIEGLTGGASVAKADGITSAKTDAISGESAAAFTFANGTFNISGQDDDGVEFVLDGQAKVVGISGLAETATVTGDLNGVVINGSKPAIQVVGISGPNTNLTFEEGILSGVVAGDTVISADGVGTVKTSGIGKFTFGETDGQEFTVASDSAVEFIIDKSAQPKVIAVDDLTGMLSGDLGGLSTINGKEFDVFDPDSDFGVIGKGKGEGLSAIYDLSDGAAVINAGGAEIAGTNTDGTFFFGAAAGTSMAQAFVVSGDASVAFGLQDNQAIGVDGLSGAIIGEMDSAFTVNDKTFEIIGDKDNVFVVAGTNDESGIEAIAGVGGESGATVEIVDAGGASGILTDAAGNFKFQDGKEFETDDEEVAFSLDKEGAVTAIDLLEGYAKGDFGGVSSVNGKTFDVVEEAGTADGLLKIVGSESAIDSIEEVGGVAYINNVGGAKEVVTNTEGTFAFAEPGRFIVAGDSSVTFEMDPDAEAKVLGITGFGDEGPATITGALGEVNMEGVAIDIVGDADNEFSYEIDENGNSVIGDVGGLSGVTINGVGGASKVKVNTAGEYIFPVQKYELGADSATFAVDEGTNVTAIEDLNGEVLGNFTADGFKVNGQALQIAGDSTIIVEGIDGNAIENLARLCDGAQIIAASGVTSAKTASGGTFTFADGREINILGDSSVTFTLDGKGNLLSINDLDENAIVSGDLNGILIENEAPSIMVIGKEGINKNLTLVGGTLFGLVDGDTVVSADGVSAIATKEQGIFTFGMGGESFAVLGDSYIEFSVEPGTTNVTAIKELDGARDILVVGQLNNIPVNGTSAIDIQGDTDEVFGVFAHANGIAAVGGVGGSAVTVNSAGGASRLFTSEVGEYTFASGQKFRTYGDSFVDFDLDGDKVTGIGQLSGAAQDRFGVRGDFTGDGVTVNRELVQVEGDDDIIVAGDDRKVTGIGYFNADATLKAWGSASGVFSKGEGEFTFDNGELPAQVFNVAGDSLVAFIMGASTAAQAVVGVEGLEKDELKFDTGTKELTVNKEYNGTLTFDTEEDVTLSIEDFKIVGLSGITGGVSGVENAVINASGPINVNGKAIDVTDSDNSYKVEVTDGEAGKITDVTADAIVNVANATVETDPLSEGVLEIGGESYTFTDEDGITFETDENGLLSAVAGLSGTMEIPDGTADLTINGDALDIANGGSAPVTVTGDDNGITAIDRLTDGAVVNGDVEDAAISTYGNSSTLPADAVDFSINGNDYALIGDEDGVTVKGNEITGLDDNASLRVGDAGEYNVNGEELDADAGDVIVGDGEDGAYIYDPVASPVRVNTPEEEIMDREGVWNGYETQILPPPEGPLDAAGLSAALKGVDLNQPIEIWTTNGDSKTPQNLDFENYDGTKKVHLYDGPQAVEFNDEFGNMVHVEKGATGKKVVEFGDGGNLAIMDENGDDLGENQVGFIGGADEDTYYVRGTAQTNIDMGGADGGADKVHILPKVAARVTLEDYDYTSGAGIAIEDRKAKDIAQAIEDGFINFGEGTVEIGEAIVDVGQQAGGTMVNLFALGSEVPQAVGFTGSEGGEVGDANAVADLILIGNKDGKKTGGSNLIGGGGNDTAFLGAGDYANLGGGSNVAILDSDTNRGGAEIAVTPQRLDIYNMNNTNYEGYGDVLAFDLEEADMSFDGTNLIVEGEDFVAVAHDAKKAGGYDFAESADTSGSKLVSDGNYVNQLVRSNGELVKTAIGAQSSIMEVEQDEDIRATYYKGNDSGVTFGEYKGEVVVDLGGDWQSSSIDEDEATFIGINKLQAASVGDSKSQFKGSSENETLIAGVGYASMYGDGGNNHLYGYEGDDKEGTTTFMVLGNANGAANTIEGFNWVEDDNYTDTQKVTADKIEVDLNTNHISTVDISGNDVVFTVTRNDDPSRIETAIVKDGVGKDIWFNDIREGGSAIVAQVGTDSVVFDKYANYYNAQEGDAVVEVDSALDSAQVYLDGSKGKTFVGNFKTIDAQDFAGKAELAGGYLDDVIYAGSGDNSLWGGKGGDDALLGGAGRDTFFYAFGNGTDTAVAGEGDVVELAGMTLDQLSGTKIDDTSIEVSFKDGGKLTVNDGGVSGIAFNVGGNTYYADHDTKSWSKKA